MTDGDAILANAAARPDDVTAQIGAAYHCDAQRTEEEAIVFYDAAWKLGPPEDDRRQFLLGYGSTLKNVGRLEQSEEVLRQAVAEYPADRALPIFLALTLHARGKSDDALAELLDVLVRVGDVAPDVGAYSRALSGYAQELRGA